MDKWFDLGARGSLRWRTEGPLEMLRLELARPPARERLEAAREAGWTLPDATNTSVLDNHKEFTKASEIATALEAFFKPNEIRAFYKVAKVELETAERPKETADSLSAAEIVKVFGEQAPPGLVERAKRVIETAQAITGARVAAAAELPFGGDGFGVLRRLSERIGAVEAALWFGHVAASTGFREDWRKLNDGIIEAAAGGAVKTPAINPSTQAEVRHAVELHRLASSAMPTAPIEDYLAGRVMRHKSLGYRALDGAHITARPMADLGQHSLRLSPGVASSVGADAAHRLSLAMSAAATALGRPRAKLFGENAVRFVISPSAGSAAGVAKLQDLSDRAGTDVTLVTLTPTYAGVALHEIAHQVHYAAGVARFNREIEGHSFFRETEKLIALLEARGVIQPGFAAYLRDPAEMFARGFDGYVADQAGSRAGLAAAGGAIASIGEAPFTVGIEATRAFMADMKPVLRQMTDDRSAARASARPGVSAAAMMG